MPSDGSGSVHEPGVTHEHLVVYSADPHRGGRLPVGAGNRKHDHLIRRERGLEAYGRSGLALGERGDHTEAVVFDGVVGNAGKVSEVDAVCLSRLQIGGMGCVGLQAGVELKNGILLFLDARNLTDKRYVSDVSTVTDARRVATQIFSG